MFNYISIVGSGGFHTGCLYCAVSTKNETNTKRTVHRMYACYHAKSSVASLQLGSDCQEQQLCLLHLYVCLCLLVERETPDDPS